jgi:ubiquinone/menaquinone biosynthesis C-methylase UbiE
MHAAEHWQDVYSKKSPESVSWFQATPTLSPVFIRQVAPARDAHILDVGGGASTLVDTLLDAGYANVTVLDLAPAALVHARERLGVTADAVTWLAADVLTVALPAASIDVWHDRAVFHFLTQPEARAQYLAQLRHVLRPGGYVIIATFAEDGPMRCSGLEVARYSAHELHLMLGDEFALVTSEREVHTTPSGSSQAFTYCVCRWLPARQLPAVAAPESEG